MRISKLIKKNIIFEEIINFFFKFIVDASRHVITKNKAKNDITVIIALRKLGDSVFTIPAIKEIRKRHTGKLYLICFTETAAIYRTALYNIDIITLSHNDYYFNDRVAKHKARKLLQVLNPGRIIDLTGVITSATLIFSSRAEKIIGANENYFRSIYTGFIVNTGKCHLIDQYINVISNEFKLNGSYINKEFDYNLNPDGYIIVHPFAGWSAKEWNFTKFIALAKEISLDYDCYMAVPPGYIDGSLVKKVNTAGIKLKETKNTDELISFIGNSSVFISNDSGPLQIASLLGKATFTIYGPTNPAFHLPYGKNHGYIQKIINCSPKKDEKYCFTDAGRDGCPSFECMNLLSVEEVIPKVMDFISRLNIKRKTGQAAKPGEGL